MSKTRCAMRMYSFDEMLRPHPPASPTKTKTKTTTTITVWMHMIHIMYYTRTRYRYMYICICTRCRSRTTICQSTFSFLNSMFIKTRIIHPSIPSMLNVVRCRQTWNYIRFFACTFYDFSIMIHTLIIHSEVHITYYYYLTNSTVVLYS